MKHARTLMLIVALAAGAGQAPAAKATSAPTTGVASPATQLPLTAPEPWEADYPASTELPGATVYAQTAAQVAELQWALDRYAAAGLELPHVEAWLHSRRSQCDGPVRQGRSGFATWRAGVSIIFNCGSRHTILHELGHVWDRHALTDADREAFMALRGVEEWQSDVWLQSGQEHLADVLAWALSPAHERHAQTEPRDEASLTAAYQLATGFQPLPGVQRGKEGRS